MMKFRENEDAVSPVIGVILMVAITVILAAVIAAFVFGMTGNVATTKTVAATTQLVGGDIVVTYQGGPDHAAVISVTCDAIVSGSATSITDFPDTISEDDLKIGYKWSVPVTKGEEAQNILITVTAAFSDGSEQVILDKVQHVPATLSEG